MTVRRWVAIVSWYAETPDDDNAADALADAFADRLLEATNGMAGVIDGSAGVGDLDTVDEP